MDHAESEKLGGRGSGSSLVKRAGSECLLWRGPRTKAGYGYFWVGHERVLVHRFAYELSHGPIPARRRVRHTCRYRHCVAGAHLFLGGVGEAPEHDTVDDAERVRRLVVLGVGPRAIAGQLGMAIAEVKALLPYLSTSSPRKSDDLSTHRPQPKGRFHAGRGGVLHSPTRGSLVPEG